MSVDKLQDAEEEVAQLREEAAREQRAAREAELRERPLADTALRPHRTVTAPLEAVRAMANMRTGPLADVHELAVSIKEAGLLHPPLVRETGDRDVPYELLAGQRRLAAMHLLDEAEGPREDWRFTVIEGVSRREALTMQFAENFHQSRPEPIMFARAVRRIMAEDPSLTAAEVSRLVGAPAAWTRRALRLLELPAGIVERVERGDLTFTSAELVRRGIARGDVGADEAAGLVERHAAGELTAAELKHGVGYVPPPPPNYDELSRGLDDARRAPRDPDARDYDDDPAQRDWERAADPSGPVRASRADGAPGPAPSGEPAAADADVDAYLLGLVLFNSPADRRRTVLRIASQDDAYAYALSLRPAERLQALRSLGAELLAADEGAPVRLREGRAARAAPAAS